jgi:hypothetical protein
LRFTDRISLYCIALETRKHKSFSSRFARLKASCSALEIEIPSLGNEGEFGLIWAQRRDAYLSKKKALLAFFDFCRQGRNAERLLKGVKGGLGSRILPPRVAKHDDRLGFRIDQGNWNKDDTYNIVVQENGRPHGKVLAATVVHPKVDIGQRIVDRLLADAKLRGYL